MAKSVVKSNLNFEVPVWKKNSKTSKFAQFSFFYLKKNIFTFETFIVYKIINIIMGSEIVKLLNVALKIFKYLGKCS